MDETQQAHHQGSTADRAARQRSRTPERQRASKGKGHGAPYKDKSTEDKAADKPGARRKRSKAPTANGGISDARRKHRKRSEEGKRHGHDTNRRQLQNGPFKHNKSTNQMPPPQSQAGMRKFTCRQDASGTWRWASRAQLVDFIDDRVRSRCLGVTLLLWAALAVLLLLPLAIVDQSLLSMDSQQAVYLTWAGTASETSLMLGPQDSMRSPWPPKLLVHNSGSYPVRGMQLSLQSRLLAPSEGMPGPDCMSTVESFGPPMGSQTLEMEGLAEACRTVAKGSLKTGGDGIADLQSLEHLRGPPGLWQFRIEPRQSSSGLTRAPPLSTTLELRVTGRVARVRVLSAWTMRRPVLVREDIPQQPVVLLTDADGLPVSGATCIAYSSDRPEVHRQGRRNKIHLGVKEPRLPFSNDIAGFDELWANALGQQVAILTGAVSRLSNATGHVEWGHLAVQTSTAPWTFIHIVCEGVSVSWHLDRPTAHSTGLPLPPVAAAPIWLRPQITSISLEHPDGSRWSDQAEAINITEGSPIPHGSLPVVRLLDIDRRPVPGARVAALVTGNGLQWPFPLRHKPAAVASSGASMTSIPDRLGAKELLGGLSTQSSHDGTVSFPNLRFSTLGAAGRLLAQSLTFCAEGVCTDGSTEAVTFQVMSRVESVSVQQAPGLLRESGGSSGDFCGPSCVAVLRILDRNGQGVSGKHLDSGGVMPVLQIGSSGFQPLSGIEISTASTSDTGSDKDGFLQVSIAVRWAARSALARARHSPVRLVFSVDDVQSTQSPPVELDLEEPKTANGNRCAALRTLRSPSESASAGIPFTRSAIVQSVDSAGDPVPGLVVVAVSREPDFECRHCSPTLHPSKPTLYRMGTIMGPDLNIVSTDGIALMQFDRRVSGEPWRGKEADLILSGPPGTLLLQYVAMRPKHLNATRDGEPFTWDDVGCGRSGELCQAECESEVFPVSVAGTGLSGVGYGLSSATSEDVWLEDPVALEPLVPIEWTGPVSMVPVSQAELMRSVSSAQSQQTSAAKRQHTPVKDNRDESVPIDRQSLIHGGNVPAAQPAWANDVAFGAGPGSGSRRLSASQRQSNGVLAHANLRAAALIQEGYPLDMQKEQAMQDALQRLLLSGFASLHVKLPAATGAPGSMTPRQVVPYLLGAPPHPSMMSLDPMGNMSFACPSDQVPHCWLDATKGHVVKGHAPAGCAICQALSSEEWMFHVSPLVQFMQPLGGAGGSLTDPDCICSSEGYPALGVIFSQSHPGEYNIAFRSLRSSSIGAPMSLYVQSRVYSMEIKDSELTRDTTLQEDDEPVFAISPSVALEPSERVLRLQFTDETGRPVAGVRAVATPVLDSLAGWHHSSGEGGVAFDAGKQTTGTANDEIPAHQGVLPTVFTSVSDSQGIATFVPRAVSGIPGTCFWVRFRYMPCGPDGKECPAAYSASINLEPTAVESDLSMEQFCVLESGTKGMATVRTQPPSIVRPGQQLHDAVMGEVLSLSLRLEHDETQTPAISRETITGVGVVASRALAGGPGGAIKASPRNLLQGNICWYLGLHPISAGCKPLVDIREAKDPSSGRHPGSQGKSLMAGLDGLSVMQGDSGDSLTLEIWPGASGSQGEGAVAANHINSRTRTISLSTEIHIEILSAIPSQVDVGGLLVVQARLTTPTHAPLRDWHVEASLVAFPVQVDVASVSTANSPVVKLGGQLSRTDGSGVATLAIRILAAASRRYELVISPLGGNPKSVGMVAVEGVSAAVWETREGRGSTTGTSTEPFANAGEIIAPIGIGILMSAFTAFSYPGNCPSMDRGWSLLGLFGSLAALALCWLMQEVMPVGWGMLMALLPTVAACCHVCMLSEWIWSKCASGGNLKKKRLAAPPAWDFEGQRNRAAIDYTRRLIYGSSVDEEPSLSGALDIAPKPCYRFHWWRRGGGHSSSSCDAFFYPQRLLAAALASAILVVATAAGAAFAASTALRGVVTSALVVPSTQALLLAITTSSSSSNREGPVPISLLCGVNKASEDAEQVFAVLVPCICGWAALGCAVSLYEISKALHDFRSGIVLQARKGRGPVPEFRRLRGGQDSASAVRAAGFLGASIARVLLGWICAFVFGVVLTVPWAWRPSREWLLDLAVAAAPALLSVLTAWALASGAGLAVQLSGTVLSPSYPMSIRNQRYWMCLELSELLLMPLAGLWRGLLQVMAAACRALLSLLAMDDSPAASGSARDALLILSSLHHQQTNPVSLVAAFLLARGGDSWRCRRSRADVAHDGGSNKASSGRLTKEGQRARVRFKVALLLARNPWLREARRHGKERRIQQTRRHGHGDQDRNEEVASSLH